MLPSSLRIAPKFPLNKPPSGPAHSVGGTRAADAPQHPPTGPLQLVERVQVAGVEVHGALLPVPRQRVAVDAVPALEGVAAAPLLPQRRVVLPHVRRGQGWAGRPGGGGSRSALAMRALLFQRCTMRPAGRPPRVRAESKKPAASGSVDKSTMHLIYLKPPKGKESGGMVRLEARCRAPLSESTNGLRNKGGKGRKRVSHSLTVHCICKQHRWCRPRRSTPWCTPGKWAGW